MAQQRRGLGRGLGALIPESVLSFEGEAARGGDPALLAGRRGIPAGTPEASTGLDEVVGARYAELAVTAIT
ncbi:MAG: ParB/RepB/Spo0J family partition protein, partial [Streptosporangiaceae bacterium]